MATVLIPIPDMDSTHRGRSQLASSHRPRHVVVFATESGRPGAADDIMVSGRGLDVWSRVPGLAGVVGVVDFCAPPAMPAPRMRRCWNPRSIRPIAWTDAGLDDVDALLLPGGHRARVECAATSTARCCNGWWLTPPGAKCSLRRSATACSSRLDPSTPRRGARCWMSQS